MPNCASMVSHKRSKSGTSPRASDRSMSKSAFSAMLARLTTGRALPLANWLRARSTMRSASPPYTRRNSAVISLLDIVISVDTAVAHLAGALGKPVMILLPYAADFRWMRGRDDSPWYPGAKLYRQPAFGDWGSVIARAADELRRLALGFR